MALLLVNMIPNSLSGETGRDSECNVAVDPADPLNIAASAFTLDPMNSGNAPVFVSVDGGLTWTLNVVLPGGNKTGDTTLRFGGTSGVLYGGILRSDNSNLNILRKAGFNLPGLMTILVDRANDDQPWVEAATVQSGPGAGSDRVYIGNNDFTESGTTGHTATIDDSLNAATAAPPAGFASVRLEPRATAATGAGSQDGPSIRPAVHADGTVYGAYFGWRTFASPANTSDVVVVRDDNWASAANPFQALLDPQDSLPGLRVVTGVSIPALSTLLGTQRIGSQLSIAVDPRNSSTVYLAWADGTSAANYTIRVRRSTNRGVTWTADLRTVVSATNPALAVNSQGRVGLLYQEWVPSGAGNRWQTHLEISNDGLFASAADRVLANVPDANGSYTGVNPIGDYSCLLAVGTSFYGVFSANNAADLANFPNGVTYRRNADFGTHQLRDLSNSFVATSIDPFFFRLTEDNFQVVGLTEDGGMWHTMRRPDSSWQPSFGDVKAQESNDPGEFEAVGSAGVSGELQVVGLTEDGGMWHTIRHLDGSWVPSFGDVKAQESNDPGEFGAVSCAAVNGELHVVGLTEDGGMWHTIRHANGSWQPFFGDVKAQESNDPGEFKAAGTAGVSGELHVVGVTDDGGMWHTIRHVDGSWQPSFGDVKAQESNDPGEFDAVACASVNGELHVVGLTEEGGMWHTIRHVDGSWQPSFGDVKAQESNDPGEFQAVGCASVDGELQLVGVTEDGGLWHTIRHPNGSWQPFFGDVKAQESNDPGEFKAVACADAD
jgi:hypothetical protein